MGNCLSILQKSQQETIPDNVYIYNSKQFINTSSNINTSSLKHEINKNLYNVDDSQKCIEIKEDDNNIVIKFQEKLMSINETVLNCIIQSYTEANN